MHGRRSMGKKGMGVECFGLAFCRYTGEDGFENLGSQ